MVDEPFDINIVGFVVGIRRFTLPFPELIAPFRLPV